MVGTVSSERELSMEELKRLNHPQSSLEQQTPVPAQPEPHPTQTEWAELMSAMISLERRVATQAALVREPPRTYPTQEQIATLARDVAAVREMLQQAGKRRERRISLPRLHLHIPHLSSAWLLIPVILLVLWAMWHSWDTFWNGLRAMFP
ncbi:hypothetical protein OBV_28600 [Oscillibacter valericigenes Sjm18-20]|nr:hypothetical protein OBV_28600 [Oscillibacter valericigenes Sjm18-20]